MKTVRAGQLTSVSLFILTLLSGLGCEEEETFNFDNVAGQYTGYMRYMSGEQVGDWMLIDTTLSIPQGFTATVSRTDTGFVFKFGNPRDGGLTELKLNVIGVHQPTTLIIEPSAGQIYSAASLPDVIPPLGESTILQLDHGATVHALLNLKSNQPDSAYYIQIGFSRYF